MSDMDCPYCGASCEVCHDDGHGYAEDVLHEYECHECEKTFVFETSILFSYHPQKADCLNGGKHRWRATYTYPVRYTRQECLECGQERASTDEEIAAITKERESTQ